MNKKILHIASCDKFIPPFIDFLKDNFAFDTHEFLLLGGMAQEQLKKDSNVFLVKKGKFSLLKYYIKCALKMHKSKKIILHGLFDRRLVLILFFMPWLLKKCYWVMWGGDLYSYKLARRDWKWHVRECFRRSVIKNMGFLVNGTGGDVDLAREWYGAKGKHIKCFNYPSNIYKEYNTPKKTKFCINIMVGNSADPSNNHLEVFDKLEAFKEKNIKIYTPLTYGNSEYSRFIIDQGKQRFGEKFVALTDHMPFSQYLVFLGDIDIAVFNHRRQQALGNTITLLGLGKKVYLNSASTLNGVFEEFAIEVFDVSVMTIDLIENQTAENNTKNVKAVFSKESLINSLANWIK